MYIQYTVLYSGSAGNVVLYPMHHTFSSKFRRFFGVKTTDKRRSTVVQSLLIITVSYKPSMSTQASTHAQMWMVYINQLSSFVVNLFLAFTLAVTNWLVLICCFVNCLSCTNKFTDLKVCEFPHIKKSPWLFFSYKGSSQDHSSLAHPPDTTMS